MSGKLADMFRLDGKVAMVTGGGQNLGLDMAEALAEAGADLVITSRGLPKVQAQAERIEKEHGVRVLPLALDVTCEDSVDAAFAALEDAYGRLDILVNNAGGNACRVPFEDVGKEQWDATMAINITGTFLCAQRAVRMMIPRKSGSIVNISSISGMVGRDRSVYEGSPDMVPNHVAYSTAKAALLGLTRDLAAAMGKHGIRVNAISPGGFERGQPAEFIRRYSAQTMLGRMGRDGVDLKGAVVYLASDASAYVTGENLAVDGGFAAW